MAPDPAKWLSPDPIGEAGGINLYAYVENNPVNLWDLLGLCPKCTRDATDAVKSMPRPMLEQLAQGDDALAAAARHALDGMKKASELIKRCKGSVYREFPEQMMDRTLDEITQMAKQGDKAAQTARKLLTDKRFQK